MSIVTAIRIKTGNLISRFPNDEPRAATKFHAFLSILVSLWIMLNEIRKCCSFTDNLSV